MALSIIKRICARIKLWLDEREEDMKQWRESDPDAHYISIEEQQRNFRGGI